MFKFPQSKPVNAMAIGEYVPAHFVKGLGFVSERVDYWFPFDLAVTNSTSGQGVRVSPFSNSSSK